MNHDSILTYKKLSYIGRFRYGTLYYRLVGFQQKLSDHANSFSRVRLCADLKKETLKSGPHPHKKLPHPPKVLLTNVFSKISRFS